MASETESRHLARALSFSVCMHYDTESSDEEEEEEELQQPEQPAEQELEPPPRLHNRNSSIMMDFAAVEQQLALQQPAAGTAATDAAAMPAPPARKPAKKQPANEGTIQVCLRVRPPSERESGDESCITELTQNSVTFEPRVKTLQSAHQVTSETYFFDRVFAPEATQTEVYEGSVESTVRGVVAGRPGLVFAFGITNAGKTFTIQGSTDQPGILPRALGQLFSMTKSDAGARVTLSFMEIYNENVYDLLGARAADAAVDNLTKAGRTGPLGPSLHLQDLKDGVVVKGLTHRTIETVEQAASHLAEGIEFRQVAHTDSNHESSRSHSLVTITLERGDGTKTNLVVVDLAGSERAKKTNADLKLKESARINTSLMNLGRCLEVLRANQKLVGSKRKLRQVVPFRQAKITRVLREPLTGGGNVVMLCSIYGGSSDADETVHALRYSSTAREVATLGAMSEKFVPIVGVNPKKRSLVPRCAEIAPKTRGGVGSRNGPRLSTMPTLGEACEESFASSSGTNSSSMAASVDSKGPSSMSAQLREAQATIAQLHLQVEANDQVAATLEDEIREEMAEEMESVMNQMEETYQSKLEREIAIHEEKFQHKLGILGNFGLDEPQRSPARVARELLELEQLRKDKADLQQTLDAQVAAVKAECARELEEARVQHSANVQMEVETIEHQLAEANGENERLKQELSTVRRQLQHVTKVSQSLIDARTAMQATATAASATTVADSADSKKTEKKDKAAKKKRKKDDAKTAKKQKTQEAAAAKPVEKESVAESAAATEPDAAASDSIAAESIESQPAVLNAATQEAEQQLETTVADATETSTSAAESVEQPKEPDAQKDVEDGPLEMDTEDVLQQEGGAADTAEAKIETETETETETEAVVEDEAEVVVEDETDTPTTTDDASTASATALDEVPATETAAPVKSPEVTEAPEVDEATCTEGESSCIEAEQVEQPKPTEKAAEPVEKPKPVEQAQSTTGEASASVYSGETETLSVTDQLKNRLNRLKKASAAASSASSAPTAPAASATRHGEEQPSADAEQPEETRTAEAAPEPLSEDGPKEKENQPPVSPAPARRSRKRRTTGKVDEEVDRFEALEAAAAADASSSSNRRLTRSAMRQRVL